VPCHFVSLVTAQPVMYYTDKQGGDYVKLIRDWTYVLQELDQHINVESKPDVHIPMTEPTSLIVYIGANITFIFYHLTPAQIKTVRDGVSASLQ
jgi:hypothetical protein